MKVIGHISQEISISEPEQRRIAREYLEHTYGLNRYHHFIREGNLILAAQDRWDEETVVRPATDTDIAVLRVLKELR